MEAADLRHRRAADALHAADTALQALQVKVDGGIRRLSELGLRAEETRESLARQIREKQERAKQYREAIAAAEKALNALRITIAESRAAAEHGQKRLAELRRASGELQAAFSGRLSEAGFRDAQEYQLAKMSEAAMQEAERKLRVFGEQKKSLDDRIAALREKLAGREKADLAQLAGQAEDQRSKKNAAEKSEAALTKKRTIHEDALKEIREALRLGTRREEYWAVVRDLYNCCAGISGGMFRAVRMSSRSG